MAGRIRQEDVQAVRERSDIVKVVSAYLQLKKAGRDRMVGICPFHAEKTPSFGVSPSKQVYHCFGCGEGGDVFKFVEKVESLTFVEVVEKLAGDLGYTLRYEAESSTDRRAAGRRSALQRANAEAADLYHRMLREGREGEDARAYLASRGITNESIARFGVGYAPGYPDFLLRRLAKTFGPDLLVDAGLVARDGSGTLRDRFRGRVTFPIHDLSGNAVGLGGRLLATPGRPAPQAAKYVNSPDTEIYHKGSLLYNLHRAKADVTRTGRVFLVEGYTDVIALDQAGVPAAVATCGTALGEEHLRLLSRFTDRAILTFDADEAGLRAAERAFQFHQQFPVDLLVLVLPEGQDPADFVLAASAAEGGPGPAGERFLALAEAAVPLVAYMIRRAMAGRRLGDVEERARAVQIGLEYVRRLEDPVRREQYAAVVADLAAVSIASVMLELQRPGPGEVGVASAGPGPSSAARVAARPGAPRPAQAEEGRPARESPEHRVEHEALRLLVQVPGLAGRHLLADHVERFTKPSFRKAFEVLVEVTAEAGPGASPADVVARAGDRGEQVGRLMAALAVEPLATGGEPATEYVDQVFLRLEEFDLRRRADAVRRDLERLNPQTAPDEHRARFEELLALEVRRRRLREQSEAGAVAAAEAST